MNISKTRKFNGIYYNICMTRKLKKYITIVGVEDDYTSLIVPQKINNIKVTVIGEGAFKSNKNIVEVLLPRGLKKIGKRAFMNCSNIISVIIPKDVRTIESEAFKGCSSLVNVFLYDKVKNFGENIFNGCDKLTEVEIPKVLAKKVEAAHVFDESVNVEVKKEVKKILNTVLLISNLTGWSWKKVKEELKLYKDKYGYDSRTYIENGIYRKTGKVLERNIKKQQTKDEEEIKSIMDINGVDRETVMKKLEHAQKKYGLSTFKYSRYAFFENSEAEVKKRLKGWQDSLDGYVEQVMEVSGWDEKTTRYRILKAGAVYKFQSDYFVLYNFWKFQDKKIATYARRADSNRLFKKYNNREECYVLKNKELFDKNYKDFIKRKFWINKETNYDEFLKFVDGLDYIFCKPIDSGGGQGTEKIKVSDYKLEDLYQNLINRPKTLVEECVVQHPEIDEFVPGCVNTIRVVTIMKDNKIDIISATIRFGYRGVVDNFHKDGMCCAVDVETGVILTNAIDRLGNIYKKHPISNKKFVGFKIPNWDLVVKCAKDAIQCQDGVNYVGWDIAVCQDKAVIIEGNCAPDLVLTQAPYADVEKGQKYLFEPYF